MIIVNQDRTMNFNYDNIEAIGVGNPLENNDGKFLILIETVSDNQYTIAEYDTEERAKEVLQDLLQKMNSQKYLLKPKVNVDDEIIQNAKHHFEKINKIDLIVDDKNFNIIPIGNKETIIYEMPKE